MTIHREELLENEWYHVRYSGEIPEIAYHSSLHHLTEDEDGPQLQLAHEDLAYLKGAAKQRYLEIILRDINPQNRDLPLYRGVLRTIANYRRFKRFCERHNMAVGDIQDEVGEVFFQFLNSELEDVESGRRQSSINCSYDDLLSFALELGVSIEPVADRLRRISQAVG